MGYINNRRNSFKGLNEKHPSLYREPFLCAEEIEGKKPEERIIKERKPEEKKSDEKESEERKSEERKPEEKESERKEPGREELEEMKARGKEPAKKKTEGNRSERLEFSSIIPVDFSNPTDEMQTEKDFRMLQSMYPNAAKELLPYIEEECDRMEYEGSAMFDEYPDFTTVYTVQKKIAETAAQTDDVCVPYSDLIRVMLLQEMHRRRERYRFCRSQC
ncbi:MAG: hypothetical protein LUD18_00715 [Lachnospiraceae bacterium]|nr:hypothetical protein [Lachnospiraceae bacterium]